MIATDRFVYIHLHKSGGSFVNECLLRFFPQARRLGYHLPRSLIPPPLQALPVLGFVRNPWSYYVSWYAFQSRKEQPNALFLCMSENRSLDFNGTVRNLLDLGANGGKLDELLQQLPERHGTRGLNLPAFALAPIRGSGNGFYSYLYNYMLGAGRSRLVVGRSETLRRDFLDFLDGFGNEVVPALRDFVLSQAPQNTSSHAPYRTYYDDRLAALVAERDRDVIGAFGYRFGDEDGA